MNFASDNAAGIAPEIMAAIAREDFCLSELDISSISARGVICHDRPNLSLSQPQSDSFPPSAVSLFQRA